MSETVLLEELSSRMNAAALFERSSRAARRGGIGSLSSSGLSNGLVRSLLQTGFAGLRSRLEDELRGKQGRGLLSGAGGPAKAQAGAAGQNKSLLIAAGYQPAVVKVISYGHGGTRATAMAQYIQRDEAKLETHDGRILSDRAAVAEEFRHWAKSFENRRESDDVASFTLTVKGLKDVQENRIKLAKAVEAGFRNHRFAYKITALTPASATSTSALEAADGSSFGELRAEVVASMAGFDVVACREGWRAMGHGQEPSGLAQKAEEPNRSEKINHRFHLSDARSSGPRSLFKPTSQRIVERIHQATGFEKDSIHIGAHSASHGEQGAVFQLARLIHSGAAVSDTGNSLASEAAVRAMAKDWKPSLQSHKPRDTMHMVLSAKADVDQDALIKAARAFLHQRFANHKFAFALHTDKAETAGHMHVHAIVAVKDELGVKLRVSPAILSAFRESYAQCAQAEGIKIVASSARHRASSQSHGSRDKSIVEAADTPRVGREERDRIYSQHNPELIANARRRIAKAKVNAVPVPTSKRDLSDANAALKDWAGISAKDPGNAVAKLHTKRLYQAASSGNVLQLLTKISTSPHWRPSVAKSSSTEQMRNDLVELNAHVTKTALALEGDTRLTFQRKAAATLEKLAIRTDIQALREQGVTQISVEQAQKLLGPHADKLVARAQALAATQQREAQAAKQVRDAASEHVAKDRSSETRVRQHAKGESLAIPSNGKSEKKMIKDGTDERRMESGRESIGRESANDATAQPNQVTPNDALAKQKLAQDRAILRSSETQAAKEQAEALKCEQTAEVATHAARQKGARQRT